MILTTTVTVNVGEIDISPFIVNLNFRTPSDPQTDPICVTDKTYSEIYTAFYEGKTVLIEWIPMPTLEFVCSSCEIVVENNETFYKITAIDVAANGDTAICLMAGKGHGDDFIIINSQPESYIEAISNAVIHFIDTTNLVPVPPNNP